jgi:hypothetical protein
LQVSNHLLKLGLWNVLDCLFLHGRDESGRVKKSTDRWHAVSQTRISSRVQSPLKARERKGNTSRRV